MWITIPCIWAGFRRSVNTHTISKCVRYACDNRTYLNHVSMGLLQCKKCRGTLHRKSFITANFYLLTSFTNRRRYKLLNIEKKGWRNNVIGRTLSWSNPRMAHAIGTTVRWRHSDDTWRNIARPQAIEHVPHTFARRDIPLHSTVEIYFPTIRLEMTRSGGDYNHAQMTFVVTMS